MKKMTNSMPEYVENDKQVYSENIKFKFEVLKSSPAARLFAEAVKTHIFHSDELNMVFKNCIKAFNVNHEELDVILKEAICYLVVFKSFDFQKFTNNDFNSELIIIYTLYNRLSALQQKNIVDKIINDFYKRINKVKAFFKKHNKSDHEIASIIFESMYGWCEPDENGRLVKVKADPLPNAEQVYIGEVLDVFNYECANLEFLMDRVKNVFKYISEDTGVDFNFKIKIN